MDSGRNYEQTTDQVCNGNGFGVIGPANCLAWIAPCLEAMIAAKQ